MIITLANVNRFLKFFHWQIPKETLCVTIAGPSTSPTLLVHLQWLLPYPVCVCLCVRADIMRQHVLPSIICSQSVSATRAVTVRNVAGHHMTLTRPPISPAAAAAAVTTAHGDGSGRPMTVEGAASSQSDIMASNGVLHIIDQVLFHSSGATFILCLSSETKLENRFLRCLIRRM